MSDRERQLDAIALLSEPSRRAIYEFVAGSDAEVTRDAAAQATGLSRVLAAFHLDRLVQVGLLEASFRRISGKGGPGAGRPSKLYRRASTPISLSLPERHYDMLAQLLADAIDGSIHGSIRDRLANAARDLGRSLAQAVKRSGQPGGRNELLSALTQLGFEPYEDGTLIRLRNCPFETVASKHFELTCSTNLCLMEGVVDGLGQSPHRVELDPLDHGCCVAFRERSA